nr:hypothetical protein [Mycobacterium spongiae]
MRYELLEFDGELRMLVIGPSRSGSSTRTTCGPRSTGTCSQVVMTMAKNIDEWLDSVEPEGPARDATHIRRIIAAAEALEAADGELTAAVAAAREAGDTWDAIGVALGTSRQAAYQRFGKQGVSGSRKTGQRRPRRSTTTGKKAAPKRKALAANKRK